MSISKSYMGIDIGSVSLNIVVVDGANRIKASIYRRTEGRPLKVLLACLEELNPEWTAVDGIVATGSGRKLVGRVLNVPDLNEIVTQATAAGLFHPNARTVIEIGGQDSKLIFLHRDPKTGETVITDHVLNDVCAAGTGSFLDLQAHRLGISIQDLGALALSSRHPARVSGRCSVFAKSDMVHLLQEGTAKADIVAGLCHALALNFITNLGKGKPFPEPIVFQGGVAANPGVVDALEKRLRLEPGALVIPKHFLVMGAFGAALMAPSLTAGAERTSMDSLRKKIADALDRAEDGHRSAHLRPLARRESLRGSTDRYYETLTGEPLDTFLGVDVGAVSTNIVLIDRSGRVVAKQYWYTKGEPVDTVRSGLEEMAASVGESVRVRGAGVTGSGRYFIGDFVGADVVINEISAQARAAIHLDAEVDTIIEIGGQDSKFIRCNEGRVLDFEMNKVCAAGTGSFLEEQAARLKVPIQPDFSELAFSSHTPADLGARCTVFMESDLVHHQQAGENLEDLTAGLAYAIVQNYLEKVVGSRSFGRRIVFQGGVAANQSVAAAFENILEKPLVTSEHHNVTGALGAALAAMDRQESSTRFAGFHLKDRSYETKTFECQKCPNLCRIHQIYVEGRLRSYYGSLCGRYERKRAQGLQTHLPDLFEERERHLLAGYDEERSRKEGSREVIGIPRALSFFDYFPFWATFFQALGHPVILSETTNKTLIEKGFSHVPSETCFPIKTVYGHVSDLLSRGAERILLPCEIDHRIQEETRRSFNCPYIQSMSHMVKAAMGAKVKVLAPVIRWRHGRELERSLAALGRSLGHREKRTKEAVAAACRAQARFDRWRQIRGREILAALGSKDRCLVLLGKAHNLFDPGLNLHLVRKLRRQGELAIPFDMVPLDEVTLPPGYDNVVWKNTRDLLKTVLWMDKDERLFPLLLTNFGCGPDSFLMKYMEAEVPDKPILILELDDHTGDAGMVTRVEAFLDTLERVPRKKAPSSSLNLIVKGRARNVDAWGPQPEVLKTLEGRQLYFPYVSEAFSTAVETAFRASGINAKSLPEPDDESEHLGRQVTSGRECHPFIVTCGDFVKLTRKPGFDPDRSAVWMGNYDGACRFSQYGIGHAHLFKRLEMPQIPVLAPLTSPRSDEFSGLFGLGFTKHLWQGWLSFEVLERIRLHVRPYEVKPGETDKVFARGMQNVVSAMVQHNGRGSLGSREIFGALKGAADSLSAVPVDRSEKRPVIGMVGEFFTLLNGWANQGLVRTLESLGAEVMPHGLAVTNFFTLFSQEYYARNRLKEGRVVSAFYYFFRNQWIMSWVKRVEGLLPKELRPFGTLGSKTILQEVAPFIHYDIDPVLATFTARVRRYAASGVSGICNLFVFNCMLGNICVPVFKRALQSYQNLPVLHAVFDGQKQTNMLTRIEAFVHQAKLYHAQHPQIG
jgi:predicted CoA-substrate-specific enzyme activase